MFFRNRNPAGLFWNWLFGLAEAIDAVTRVLTFGVLATNLPLTCSRYQAKYGIKRMKKLDQTP